MQNLLITGSSGFIGKYFIKKYEHKYAIKVFSFLKDDINNLDCSTIDVIFHLSALVHQMDGANEEQYEKINYFQTIELARKAKESGVKQFIFMSTVKVYGEENNHKYNENSKCTPEDAYGRSKLKAELEIQKLQDKSFTVSIIRTPIVYGYGVKANIKSLINLVYKLPILPFGSITNRRSMVYIGNLSHLVDLLIEQKQSGVFLASDDEPLSTTNLIKLIAKNLDIQVYLLKIPFFQILLKIFKPNFHKRLYESLEVDNSITKEKLQLKNPYSVEEGIKFMIHGENI
ncbi:MAG: NAD-dependent epimerase/dehydratase family protein [Arcobacteraceae bacterium]|jgi:UDP-glucose 4-epimerase|nr:NAD-dependent epimerase/dehydratase family protein [Arcobacteraceae bacterium]